MEGCEMAMTKSAADDTFTAADDWQGAGFDRKQSKALARIVARLEKNQEALMAHQKTLASKETLARLEKNQEALAAHQKTLTSKEDLARLEKNQEALVAHQKTLASKEDLARLEKNQEALASKENLARVEKNQETLATKDALASLRMLMVGVFLPIQLALLILITTMMVVMLDLSQEINAIKLQVSALETRMTAGVPEDKTTGASAAVAAQPALGAIQAGLQTTRLAHKGA